MKDTNEIEKQLQQKADKYLKQKAEEMFNIHREIAQYLGTDLPSYIDYITDYSEYSKAYSAEKPNFFTSSSPSAVKLKFEYDLRENYKQRVVAKYTKELLDKIAIF